MQSSVTQIRKTDRPRCLGYVRVSTPDQRDNGLSLDVQQAKIIAKAQELNGELIEDIYIDGGISGCSTEGRHSFMSLYARCMKGDIDYVIVQDSSRVARNPLDYLVFKEDLKKHQTKIIPLTGNFNLNNNPLGDVMDELIAVVNSIHPRLTSYKVKQTAAEKFKAGYYPSWAPLGYKNIDNPSPSGSYDKKIIIPNPDTSLYITQAFKMYATRNYSIYDIRQYLHKNGVTGKKGKDLQYSIVGNMLKNTFYYGLMKHGGLEGMGKHTPLIDKNTFDLVQKIMEERNEHGLRARKHNFLLRGVLFCKDCGRRYVAEYHYNSKYKTSGGKCGMYHCSQTGKRGGCPSHAVSMSDIESQVQAQVEKLQFTDEFVEAVRKNITQVYEDSMSRLEHAKKALYNKRDAVDQKRTKIEKDYFESKLSAEQLQKFNTQLDAEALSIQKQLAEQDKVRTIDVSIVNEVLKLTRDIVTTYNSADTDHKRAYLHFFFQKIWVQNKQIVEVEYTPAIQVLNEAKLDLGILSTNWLPG